ncbi:hydrogenase expression/formation protein HypE [Sporanaerobium hydrogeniformans]|uniref:Hydrogenase expression/formation protein HypE n=1 Tax=Sporanaerobium hydrogeniformans TaxID=3072179 RepID=A0AC61DF73_9FIRM|nr:hydrogenase expression/formation protein HypE [Sporanaerobium hydrogeniformans]PHV71865.1 hydrogenase expression/formation protein HypE [Sporanaerobium hydrogeniformans]
MKRVIELLHGSGGIQSRVLIEELFYKYFDNTYLRQNSDAVYLEMGQGRIAFTTDSYVVTPLFFPGGDIGKLAVYGTVNDLAVRGSQPLYLSCSMIIEEGLELTVLEKVVESMHLASKEAGVQIVTGDTKVVPNGKGDSLYINTAGIGIMRHKRSISPSEIRAEDDVIITGSIGEHEIALLLAREEVPLKTRITSDCAPLGRMLNTLCEEFEGQIHMMRDPTRGGLATVLNEIISSSELGIEIEKSKIPIQACVQGVCELLGIDPFYSANEGKAVIVCDARISHQLLKRLHTFELGRGAAIIGKVVKVHKKKVWVKTKLGTYYVLAPLSTLQVPRIC